MAKVKRDDIKRRNVAKDEPRSKLKYLWALLGWGPWAYGVFVLLGQGITFWMDLSEKIFPRITAEVKVDPAFPHINEFTFKNEGRLALRDVVLDTLLIWHEPMDGPVTMPYADSPDSEPERVTFRDQYSYLGEIPPNGGTASANLSVNLPDTKKVGICQELSFQMFPLDWLGKLPPINKLTRSAGFMIDKPAGVHTWRKIDCTALRKNMPDRKRYEAIRGTAK